MAEPTVEVMPVALAGAPIEPEPEDTLKAEAEVAMPEGVAVAEVEVEVKTEVEEPKEPQSPSSRLRQRGPPAFESKAKPKAEPRDGKPSKRSKKAELGQD